MHTKKDTIAIVTISSHLSGAEKRFIRIAFEICKFRDDILLVINKELLEEAKKDTEIKRKIDKLNQDENLVVLNSIKIKNGYIKLIINFILNFIDLKKTVKKHNIKVLHCSLGALRQSIIKKFTKVKVIAEITSPDMANNIKLARRLKYFVSNFDLIIAVSQGVKNRTIESLNTIGKETLIERLSCSSIPFFLPNENGNNSKMYNNEKENLLVFASRFIERKNPILFAKAVNKFLNQNSSWNVAILGEGPLTNKIREELKQHIDNNRVIVEHSNDIYSYLRRSKIFISLIYPDNYPSQSILEAMYMKNAILATNIGHTYRLVSSENGFLVNDYEVDSVVNTLIKATSNEDSLIEMGENSFEKIKQNFSKDIYLKELTDVYDNIK